MSFGPGIEILEIFKNHSLAQICKTLSDNVDNNESISPWARMVVLILNGELTRIQILSRQPQ